MANLIPRSLPRQLDMQFKTPVHRNREHRLTFRTLRIIVDVISHSTQTLWTFISFRSGWDRDVLSVPFNRQSLRSVDSQRLHLGIAGPLERIPLD